MANDNLEIRVTAGGVEETVSKLNTVNDKVEELASKSESIQALGSSFAKLSAAIAVFATAAIYAAVKTDELRQALDNVGGQGTVQFAKFSEEANKLGLGIEAIAKSAIKLEATGLTNDTTRRLIDSVGEAVRKMGGGDAQFTTVINGLEMVAATGVLTNRSLRTIEKTAPELKGAIEQAFGTDNTKKILAMNMTVEDFMSKIATAAAKMSPHTKTMGDAFIELKNTVLVSMGGIGDTIATDLKLVEALGYVSEKIRNLIKAFQDLDPATRKAIEYFGLLMAAIGPILLAIPVLIALFTPLGLAVVGVGIIIAGLIAYWDQLKTFTGYLVAALYSLKAGFEMLLYPILAVGGMVLKLAGFLLDGTEGFKAASKAVDGWTDSLYKNIVAADKKAEQTRQNTSDLIRLKAEYDKMAAADAGIAGFGTNSDAKQTGNETKLHGQGNGPKEKVAKQLKERIADVQVMEDQVSVAQMEADDKAAKKRWDNQAKLYKLGLGMTIEQIEKQDAEYKAVSTKLSTSTELALEKLRTDNQKAYWASNPLTPAMVKSITEFNQKLSALVTQGVNDMASTLASGLGKAFEAGNFKDLGKGLLATMGGLMVQFGQLLIATGIGIIAIKESLKSLNPVLAIAGGIALVALGTFVSDSASSIASGGGAGTAASATGAMATGGGGDGNFAALQKMAGNSMMSAKVVVKGADLALVMQRNNINTRQR